MLVALRACLAALPLVAAVATPAGARESVTVEGCYGAATAVFCDVTVSYGEPTSLRWTTVPVPVCAGSCQTYHVPMVGTNGAGEPLAPCVEWEGPAGSGECRYPEDQ